MIKEVSYKAKAVMILKAACLCRLLPGEKISHHLEPLEQSLSGYNKGIDTDGNIHLMVEIDEVTLSTTDETLLANAFSLSKETGKGILINDAVEIDEVNDYKVVLNINDSAINQYGLGNGELLYVNYEIPDSSGNFVGLEASNGKLIDSFTQQIIYNSSGSTPELGDNLTYDSGNISLNTVYNSSRLDNTIDFNTLKDYLLISTDPDGAAMLPNSVIRGASGGDTYINVPITLEGTNITGGTTLYLHYLPDGINGDATDVGPLKDMTSGNPVNAFTKAFVYQTPPVLGTTSFSNNKVDISFNEHPLSTAGQEASLLNAFQLTTGSYGAGDVMPTNALRSFEITSETFSIQLDKEVLAQQGIASGTELHLTYQKYNIPGYWMNPDTTNILQGTDGADVGFFSTSFTYIPTR